MLNVLEKKLFRTINLVMENDIFLKIIFNYIIFFIE